MENRIEIARKKHKEGYNCAQAVFCAYCDLLGMDEQTAFKFSEGFGGGMGGMHETCGAVTAMYMLAGLKHSDGLLDGEGKTKKETYSIVKQLAEEFKNSEGSTICRELLEKNKETRKTCNDRVGSAAEVIEKLLLDNQ